ncbi:MAG: hypothetical protein JNL79_32745 [Myxococcales bacterium]|nr:hypothetical protein [Myxococcales bacterium]
MELLASYGKRTKRDEHAMGIVVSTDVIGANGRPFSLRTGQQLPGFVPGVAFSRAGHSLIVGKEGAAVKHADGRVVPLKVEGTGMIDPLFVGSALVMQDDPTRGRGLGVFDIETGELRGRLEHDRMVYGTREVVEASLCAARELDHVWATDRTSLRLWNLNNVRCSQSIPAQPGTTFDGVCLLPDGCVVTGQSGGGVAEKIVVFEGLLIARERELGGTLMGVAFDRLIVQDMEKQELHVLDPSLELVETLSLREIGLVGFLPLWSDQREFLAVDWHNQVHHFGEASLRPSGVAAETPAPKKKASKKKA